MGVKGRKMGTGWMMGRIRLRPDGRRGLQEGKEKIPGDR